MAQVDTPQVDKVIRQTEVISATGIALASLEYLMRPKHFEESGLLSWQVGRTKYRWTSRKSADVLNPLFRPPGVQGVIGLRLTAASLLIAPGAKQSVRTAAVAYLAVSNWLLHIRNSYGTDGTDHMNMLVYAALTLTKLFPGDTKAKEICTKFIAGQSVLSYLAAGAAKAVSPYWRDGSAMSGVFRTHTYGERHVGELLKKFPSLAKAGGWGTIIGESIFPLVLFGGKKTAVSLLATGAAFHAGNAAFMGLNRFLWAFCSTYPAVMHHSRSLRKR
ncbi:hypothetical protein [Amycolatopsis sp. CA-230715]|uniref:hypothetical protein n=1 Tax=Amycolatopsis sp. CA-230715 TaxID=2745196 RepID=UPI001C01047B|nr:hypothetical protein [Amycolatopsis sp. CA-230715]QWF82481.1 hypothetical protein HUW46_05918 [Amycolatopsis sp. CA-230715]